MSLTRLAATILVALIVGAACGSSSATGVTADQVRTHPEATLTYRGAHDVVQRQVDEYDGGGLEPLDPAPAYAEISFNTADNPQLVIAWYETWLEQHAWKDAEVQGDGQRYWVRGPDQDFVVDCSRQLQAGDRACHVSYVLRSARFKAHYAAAPVFGDPVSLAAVSQRRVGLAATQDFKDRAAGVPIPRDGTPEASAARAQWRTTFCCATPIIVLDKSAAEQGSPVLSAYHTVTVEVADYKPPDAQNFGYDSIEYAENTNLANAGFVLEKTGAASLSGQQAREYGYVRGDREAVLLLVAYGDPQTTSSNLTFRVATLSIIYDVAPSSCPLSTADCFNVLFGAKDVAWTTVT